MNKVILMGRIASDVEMKTSQSGLPVCSFRLAVDRNYQKAGEEKKTDFINVTAWRTTAEFITKWFGKGRLILVEGELQTRQYTDKNGNNAIWTEVVVEKAHFTGEKNNVDPTAIPAQRPAPTATTAAVQTPQQAVQMQIDDDYPF